MAEKQTPEQEAMATLNRWCAVSKKLCACCKKDLTEVKKDLKDGTFNESGTRIVVAYLDFNHPSSKRKKFRLCGPCAVEMNLT